MKIYVHIITAVIILTVIQNTFAQKPPNIQWKKCIGGTVRDEIQDVSATSDGCYILAGGVLSNNGDVSGNHSIPGAYDAWIVKVNANGIIQWQKCFGGSLDEFAGSIRQTADGGYIFVANTISNDQQIPFNHGLSDLWVVKIDASGNIQWSKTFGGSSVDVDVNGGLGSINRGKIADIELTGDGYIIATGTRSNDGDVSGLHGNGNTQDIWVLKLDLNGVLQWQKCLGGTAGEKLSGIVVMNDGSYMLAAGTDSHDGDVSDNHNFSVTNCWIVKLDHSGNLLWEKCINQFNFRREINDIELTSDGGVILGGMAAKPAGGNSYDGWIVKLDASGSLQWETFIDDSYGKHIHSINQTADGGYIAIGRYYSSFPFSFPGADSCTYKGTVDIWVTKLTSTGTTEWQRNFGGSDWDFGNRVFPTPDGGYLFTGTVLSNNGDITGSHGNSEGWIVKLGFSGGVAPSVTIRPDTNLICSGKEVIFRAVPFNGGSAPIYKWILNGNDLFLTVADSALIPINNSNDVVTCEITSNGCVDIPTALSNPASVTVDPSLGPKGFLGKDTSLCIPFPIILTALRSFPKYQWSNNSVSPSISVSTPGQYWLQVTDSTGCIGKDTIILSSMVCPSGFYVPGAFTPNGDGKNDVFKPIVIGKLLQYHFTIYGRWGQIIFDSKDINKGWDGTFKGLPQDSNIFIWICTYQPEHENVHSVKGTVALVR